MQMWIALGKGLQFLRRIASCLCNFSDQFANVGIFIFDDEQFRDVLFVRQKFVKQTVALVANAEPGVMRRRGGFRNSRRRSCRATRHQYPKKQSHTRSHAINLPAPYTGKNPLSWRRGMGESLTLPCGI